MEGDRAPMLWLWLRLRLQMYCEVPMLVPDLCPCPCLSARRWVWTDRGGAPGDSELLSECEGRRPLPLSAPGLDGGVKKGRPASGADAFEFQITCFSRSFLMMVTDGDASPPRLVTTH